MTKSLRLLPIALAATLSLTACGKHDDAANVAAGQDVANEEVISAGELGDANAVGAEGNVGDANATAPADDALGNDAETLGNGG